jgi:hypothetical protein
MLSAAAREQQRRCKHQCPQFEHWAFPLRESSNSNINNNCEPALVRLKQAYRKNSGVSGFFLQGRLQRIDLIK